MSNVYVLSGHADYEGTTVVGVYGSRESAESFKATLDDVLAQRPIQDLTEVEAWGPDWTAEQSARFNELDNAYAQQLAEWGKLFPRPGLDWFDRFFIKEHEVLP